MSTWRVRHEGSPQSIDNLTLAQVVEGLQDALWEPTDEVMGPGETVWTPIESHPQLAEVAAEIEPPPPRTYDDETRLDMNALIDVCLVLLVFFILTTSYAVLQTRMDMPNVSTDQVALPQVTDKFVENQTVHVVVKMENGKPVIRVEGKVTDPKDLQVTLTRSHRAKQTSTLLLEHDGDVPHGVIVDVEDAAKGAKMNRVLLVVPENELKR
jgi:biopolymer transport protein ExbD